MWCYPSWRKMILVRWNRPKNSIRKGGKVLLQHLGSPPLERSFAVYVEDRWGNQSDTISTVLTPYYEEQLDKSLFSAVHLPTDMHQQHTVGTNRGMHTLWDGEWDAGTNAVFHTPPTYMPQHFTFDLGQEARLTRFKIHTRPGSSPTATQGTYRAGDPKEFEIWGSNNPAQDGSWDSWELLGTFEAEMPSGGTTYAEATAEDFQYSIVEGADYQFADPQNAPAVRYVRFKTNRTWDNTTYIHMAELTFWGDNWDENQE